jgi:hypothetical protein
MILAHAGISDLAWLWKVMPDHPNLFLDTAWWNPADLITVFSLVAPSQILWASDSPYGLPLTSAAGAARCMIQAGVPDAAMRSIFGGQMARIVAGEEPAWAGDAPGPPQEPYHPLLERVYTSIVSAMGRAFGGGDPSEPIALARLACAVGDDGPHADVCAAVLELLDLFDEHLAPPPPGRPFPLAGRFMMLAMTVARTPAAPLPVLADAPHPTRQAAGD